MAQILPIKFQEHLQVRSPESRRKKAVRASGRLLGRALLGGEKSAVVDRVREGGLFLTKRRAVRAGKNPRAFLMPAIAFRQSAFPLLIGCPRRANNQEIVIPSVFVALSIRRNIIIV